MEKPSKPFYVKLGEGSHEFNYTIDQLLELQSVMRQNRWEISAGLQLAGTIFDGEIGHAAATQIVRWCEDIIHLQEGKRRGSFREFTEEQIARFQ